MAITEGCVPGDRLCLVNLSSKNAHVELTFCAEGQEPLGPFRSTVPAQRTQDLGLEDLARPADLSPSTPYAVVVVADTPMIVQYTPRRAAVPPAA
ncbi:Anabaena sensory rhodopsin transducer [Nonomuraea solani]|uniref:Sensory rhodopsin transducer n=2 Tax=Nonomuraea solani TaxID=1144553 RepID=A0A1H6EXA0_9ACTN|nr:Anabaena sensory rhodopsin transducer [Nonomuraea solani]